MLAFSPRRARNVALLAGLVTALAAPLVGAQARADGASPVADPTTFVNPLIGSTASGDTYPGSTLPFGMIQWSPVTATGNLYSISGASGGYVYGTTKIRGFSLTHLNGTGCAGLDSDVPILPYTADITTSPSLDTKDATYASTYSHANEVSQPGYYKVGLDNGSTTELTTTKRTGSARMTFPAGKPANVLFRVSNSGVGSGDPTNVTVDPTTNSVSGEVTGGGFCGANGTTTNNRNYYHLFFTAQFDTPVTSYGTWKDGTVNAGSTTASGGEGYTTATRTNKGSGAYVGFDQGSTVGLRVGISYVSAANAKLNLDTENPAGRTFDSVKTAAHDAWQNELSRIAVTPGPTTTNDQITVFYSALYHALLQPTLASDVNGQYEGADDQHGNPGGTQTIDAAHQSAEYDTLSGWDQYRGQVQLVTLLDPQVGSDLGQSLLNLATQRGGEWDRWLDRSAKTSIMEGDPSPAVEAGIRAFGGTGFDVAGATQSLLSAATVPTVNDMLNSGDTTFGSGCNIGCPGQRPALADYLKLGYVPAQNCHCWGAAGETLEDAQADYSISELARSLGHTADFKAFMQRGENWQNVFNAAQTSGTFKGYAWNKNGPIVCPPGDLGAHVTAVTTSGENPPSETAAMLKDCNNGTKWLQFAKPTVAAPLFAAYKLDGPQVVTRYSLVSGNDTPTRDPSDWQLQGSNDGTAWTTIDTQTAQSFSDRQVTNTYTVANTTAYTNYRILFTANKGDADIQLSDWSISDGSATIPPSSPGAFASGFSATSQTGFAEGSTTQYSWMVYDDVAKLASLMGGKTATATRLDTFFNGYFNNTGNSAARFDPTNEPDIQTPWMYDYLGSPSSTQSTVRRIVNKAWTNTTGGITGNDDLGTMSAWNVWSSLGMFPYNSARAELVLASPLFPKIEIHRPGGQTITINAPGADATTMYVSALKLNGATSTKPWVPASLVANGGTLDYTLSTTASTWGSDPADAPLSLSDPPTVSVSSNGTSVTVNASDPMSGIDGTPVCTVNGAPVPLTAGAAGTWSGPVGVSSSQTATCTATNSFGTSASATATVWPSSPVGGSVPATLALTLGAPAAFGAFTPGVTADYTAATTANVISTAGDATLSVADPSSTATGHLVNGAFSLPSPLQARARDAANSGTAYNNVGSSASPLNLLTYGGPISNDAVTLQFSQHIGSTDALRTGSYAKTLTFTLSTTTP
jgi:predicted alpha-1,2-mannosidase